VWVGVGGTLVFVVFGIWTLVSLVWAASFMQTLEVLVAGPIVGVWVLSPLLWAAWPRREPPPSHNDAAISFLALALMVGVGAYAYLPEFVVLPLVFDTQPQLESLMLVLVVPGLQWAIVGVAGVIRFVRTRS